MQQQLENLQNQLTTVEKYEAVFASENTDAYTAAYGNKKSSTPETLLGYMGNDLERKVNEAFDSFQFAADSDRARLVNETAALIQNTFEKKENNTTALQHITNPQYAARVVALFDFSISAISHFHKGNKHENLPTIVANVRALIAAQKAVIVAKIEDAKAKVAKEAAELEISILSAKKAKEMEMEAARKKQTTENAKTFGKKALYVAGMTSLYTVGAGLTIASGLMQFSPAFALLVGVNLPAAVLATMAITGVAMLATAGYLTYRAYHPVAPVATTTPEAPAEVKAPVVEPVVDPSASSQPTPAPVASRFAKYVNPALLVSGLSMMSFSALVQFGPKFALLAGLHLSPAALVAIAAVGTLLVSIALYRLCKSYMQARAEAAATKAAEPAPTTSVEPAATAPQTETCYQRMVKCIPTCNFRLFGTAPAQPTTTQDFGAANTAQPAVQV